MEPEKKTILVVEDNPGDAYLLREIFKQYGKGEFDLVFEQSLLGAVTRLSAEKIDAILLDLYLPDALGLETLKKIKLMGPQVPVMVLTGLYDEEIGVFALQMGADCYLSKTHLRDGNLVEALWRCANHHPSN